MQSTQYGNLRDLVLLESAQLVHKIHFGAFYGGNTDDLIVGDKSSSTRDSLLCLRGGGLCAGGICSGVRAAALLLLLARCAHRCRESFWIVVGQTIAFFPRIFSAPPFALVFVHLVSSCCVANAICSFQRVSSFE